MRCLCSLKDFKNAILAVSKALPSTSTQAPILTGIYIATEYNTVEVQATDFSLGIVVKIPAETEAEGSTVVPGKYIAEIVTKLPGNMITISNEDDRHTIIFQSEDSAFSLNTMDPDEFPKVHVKEALNSFTVPTDILKRLVEHVTFASAGITDSRPIFKGCSVSVKESLITLVSTNTHRLAVAKSELQDPVQEEVKCIVPAETLNNLVGIINTVGDNTGIKIDILEQQISFTINNFFVTCRLIDGNFPPYEKVIPQSTETSAVVEVKKFKEIINRVAIIAKISEYHAVRIIFKDDGIIVSADSYDLGKVTERMEALIEGPAIDISFNLDYFQDFLRIFPEGELRISMNDALSPAAFSFDDDENFIYIITPIRTQ